MHRGAEWSRHQRETVQGSETSATAAASYGRSRKGNDGSWWRHDGTRRARDGKSRYRNDDGRTRRDADGSLHDGSSRVGNASTDDGRWS